MISRSDLRLTPYALCADLVFDGERFLQRYAIVIHGDTVEAMIPIDELASNIRRVSISENIVAPGFVDLQLNGCGGIMFNDAITADTLRTMHETNLRSGCTAFLPTLVSTCEEDMFTAMSLVEAWRAEHGSCPVLGLHLEGPYINPARKGIHNITAIRSLSPAMREAMETFAEKIPLMVTLAPECVENSDIQSLTKAGVVVSLGHSAATYEEAKRGFAAGACAATHLFNAMSPWLGREPGLVGAALDSPEVTCGILVDGHHAHFASLALAKRLKGEACFLITDATAPVGTDMAQFSFCGQTVYVQEGKAISADGTLGGSILTMRDAVANCTLRIGWDLAETLRMASLYPARLMGLDNLIGRITPGSRASLIAFSPESFAVAATVDSGELRLWQKGT